MAERISDTKQLHPLVVKKLTSALEVAHQSGVNAHIFETYRTFERQAELYAIGRTKPGKIVTNSPPGYSWHNYGLAVDLAFDAKPETDRIDWTWSGDWQQLGKIMMAAGFEWFGATGSKFAEAPHFQITGGLWIMAAKTIYEKSGLTAVWQAFDAWMGTKPNTGVK